MHWYAIIEIKVSLNFDMELKMAYIINHIAFSIWDFKNFIFILISRNKQKQIKESKTLNKPIHDEHESQTL